MPLAGPAAGALPVGGRGAKGALTFVLAAVIAGNAVPGPLLPAYREAWGLAPLTGTLIFAVYALGVVPTIVFAGSLGDETGARPVLVLALVLSLAGAGLALVADGVVPLYIARVVQGSAAALAGPAATRALTDVDGDPRGAARLAAIGTTGGIAIGLLLAGAVARIYGGEIDAVWIAYLALLAIAILTLAPLEGVLRPTGRANLSPARPTLPPREVPRFLRAISGAAIAFACVGLLAGLGPSIALAIGIHDILAAAAISAFAYVVSGATVLTLGARVRSAVPGLATLMVGLVLLVVAVDSAASVALLACAAVIGVGNGLTFRVTLTTANGLAPTAGRAGIISTYNIAMYSAIVAPLVAVALLSEETSLRVATAVIAACIAAAALVLVALERAATAGPRAALSTDPTTERGFTMDDNGPIRDRSA